MIKVLDYGMGNCGSIKSMLRYLGADCEIASEPNAIVSADAIIIPGVGSFDNGIRHLTTFKEILEKKILIEKRPVLGICLGMQLMLERSEEGNLPGLGWIKGYSAKFDFTSESHEKKLVVPHMGWNEIWPTEHSKLLCKLKEGRERYYFVHSFHAKNVAHENIMAWCHYGQDFVCAIQKENIMGVQFHPEKSHKFGKSVFSRFIELSQC